MWQHDPGKGSGLVRAIFITILVILMFLLLIMIVCPECIQRLFS